MRFALLAPFVAPLLGSSGESDGCWAPIPASSMVSVAGSPGYTVDCSSGSNAVVNGTSFVRRHERFDAQYRKRRSSSFLKRDGDGPIAVCFSGAGSNSTMTQMAYAEVSLLSDYVIRGVDFTAYSSAPSPQMFTVNARDAQTDDPQWYVSIADLDSGAPWTNLPMGSTASFDTDLSGQYVRLVPMLSSGSASGTSFFAQLFGCSADKTSLVSFKFSSSKQAIISRFGTLSSFIDDLTEYVCQITNFTPSPSPCPRVLYSEMTDGVVANPAATADGIAPAQLPFVEVYYRILPPSSGDCSDCRDAKTVQTQLSQALSDPSSSASQLLRAIDQWIEDEDPYTCFNKQCPSGTLCVNGACVTPNDLIAQQQASSGSNVSSVQFTSTSQLDQTLNLSPLQVIQGVDTSAGQLSFSSTAIKPGTVLTSSSSTGLTAASTTAPSTTSSSSSFLTRFFIPIVVLGSIAVCIIALLSLKVYRRQFITDEQRASLVQ